MSTKIYKRNKSNKKYSKLNKKKRSILKLRGGAGVAVAAVSAPNEIKFLDKLHEIMESKLHEKPITMTEPTCKLLETQLDKQFTPQSNSKDNTIEIIKNNNDIIQLKYKGFIFTIQPKPLSVPEFQFFIDNQNEFLSINQNTVCITLGEEYGRVDKTFIKVYEDNSTPTNYEENLFCFKNNCKTFFIVVKRLDNTQEDVIVEDILWLKHICEDLNTNKTRVVFENKTTNNPTNSSTNIDYFLQIKTNGGIGKDTKIFTCFNLDVDHTKLIIEEVTNDSGEKYLILGYPDRQMKSYLELYKDYEEGFNDIYKDHKTNFMLYMAQLHNFAKKQEQKKIIEEIEEINKLMKPKVINQVINIETNTAKTDENTVKINNFIKKKLKDILNLEKSKIVSNYENLKTKIDDLEKLENIDIETLKLILGNIKLIIENTELDINSLQPNIKEQLEKEIQEYIYYEDNYNYTENFYNNLLTSEKEKIQKKKIDEIMKEKERIKEKQELSPFETEFNSLTDTHYLQLKPNNKKTIDLFLDTKLTINEMKFDNITIEQLRSYETLDASIIKIIDEYFKLKEECKFFAPYKNVKCKNYKEYFKTIYGIEYDPNFKTIFKEMQKSFYNELANKYLNKPMMNIKYVFVILKKDTDGKYVPAFFNIRELEKKHTKILEEIQKIIKTILPEIYGIINKDKNETEYDLFYTNVSYGSIFHIKTEYLHTMSNVQKQAYKYLYMISLSELIYMLSESENLKTLKLEYEKKIHSFLSYNNFDAEQDVLYKTKSIKVSYKQSFKPTKTLSSKVKNQLSMLFATLSKNSNTSKISNNKPIYQNMSEVLKALQGCKILLMFTELGYKYKFYYKDKDYNFKCITLISKLDDTIDKIFLIRHTQIFEQIKNLYLQNDKKEKIYFRNIRTLMPYKVEVESIKPLTKEELQNLLKYNPMFPVILKYKSNISPLLINAYDTYFSNTFLKKFYNQTSQSSQSSQSLQSLQSLQLLLPNSYLKKPYIVRNILSSQIYKDEYYKFTKNLAKNKTLYKDKTISLQFCIKYIENSKQNGFDKKLEYEEVCNTPFLPNDSKIFHYYNKQQINNIYFNPNNCGYTFIEKYEKNKSVVWIVPVNATDNENIIENQEDIRLFTENGVTIHDYLGNFTFLNDTHIPMLKELAKLFNTDNQEGFFNISSSLPAQYTLHLQVFPNKINNTDIHYKHSIANLQQGTRIDKHISIYTIINFIIFKSNYYNNYNCKTISYF
jgi:hypothetical protein